MKKLLLIIGLLVACLPIMVNAKEKEKVKMYVFYGEGCPHCHALFTFLDSIEKEYGEYYTIEKYETWNDADNKEMMYEVAEYLEDDFNKDEFGVPYYVIGDKTFQGYTQNWNEDIKAAIKEAYEDEDYTDKVKTFAKKYADKKRNEQIIYYTSLFVLVLVTCVAIFVKEKMDLKKNA